MREINVSISDGLELDVYTSTEDYRDEIFIGYDGENNATRLNFFFDPLFDGCTYYILWDDETTSTAQTELDLEYDIPSTCMTAGLHKMRIEIHGTNGQIEKTPVIYFRVK